MAVSWLRLPAVEAKLDVQRHTGRPLASLPPRAGRSSAQPNRSLSPRNRKGPSLSDPRGRVGRRATIRCPCDDRAVPPPVASNERAWRSLPLVLDRLLTPNARTAPCPP